MGASVQALLFWAGVLLAIVGAGVWLALLPRRREQRRRLHSLATLLRASDVDVRIEALERAHALPPRSRALLGKVLRAELVGSSRGGGSTSTRKAATVWLIRQVLGLLGDSRTAVRMDAARVLRVVMGGNASQLQGEGDDSTALAGTVAAAVQLAGGRVFADTQEGRRQTRVLAVAEMLDAGLRPLLPEFRSLEGVHEEALEPLGSALQDRSPRVRRALFEVLAAMGGERATEMLMQALRDPSPGLRARAAESLGGMDAPASTPRLVELLDDPVAEVRAAAASALAQAGRRTACGPIIEALKEECRREDADEAARSAMVEAVARLSDGGGPDLADAFASLVRPVAVRLAGALEKNGAIERWLGEQADEDRGEVVSRLLAGAAGLGVSRPFLDALDSADARVRQRSAAALGHSHHSGALMAIAALLTDPDVSVRGEAVRAAARLGGPVALGPLAHGVGDPDSAVRIAAIAGIKHVLGEQSNWSQDSLPDDFDMAATLSESQRALLLASGDQQGTVRVEAAAAFGMLPSVEAAEALVGLALSDPEESVRESAAEALSRRGFTSARRMLTSALDDEDAGIRARVMAILGAFACPEVAPHVIDGLRDSAPEVRDAALSALPRIPVERFGDRLVPELRHPDPRVRAGVAAQLGRTSAAEHVEALVQALGDPEEAVRVSALDALASTGRASRRHENAISARLSDPSPHVRQAAAAAVTILRETWAEMADAGELLLGGALSGAGAATVIDMATTGDPDPLLRALDNPQSARSIATFLGGAGRGKVAGLLSRLRQADDQTQARAAAGISRTLRHGGAAEACIAEMRALDADVRLMAVEIVGLLGTREAIAALVEVLEKDPLPEVRSRVASVLADVPDDDARAALRRARTKDPNEVVRRVAGRAVSRSAPESVSPPRPGAQTAPEPESAQGGV